MTPRSAPARPGLSLALAGRLYPEEPERPHPNCKCEISARALTRAEPAAMQDTVALQAQAARAERDRREREKQARGDSGGCQGTTRTGKGGGQLRPSDAI